MSQLKEKSGKLREGAKNKSGRREATIITEGWGSSGYYDAAVLSECGPKAWPVGTRMFMNHPTINEEMDRPERKVEDWVGTIATPPRMAGIELAAEVEVFDHWKPVIDSVSGEVGLSVVAPALMEAGAAGGREGPIVKEIYHDPFNSVDYVTIAGRGGKLGQLIESARTGKLVIPEDNEFEELLKEIREARNVKDYLTAKTHFAFTEIADRLAADGSLNQDERIALSDAIGDALKAFTTNVEANAGHLALRDPYDDAPTTTPVTESGSKDKEKQLETEELQRKLSEAETKIREQDEKIAEVTESRDSEKDRADRAEDALLFSGARTIAESEVSKIEGLPERAGKRAVESALRGKLPTTDGGKLDDERLRENVQKQVREEMEYLTGGTVDGELGNIQEAASTTFKTTTTKATTGGDSKEKLVESFKRAGMSEEAAKVAAEGRMA